MKTAIILGLIFLLSVSCGKAKQKQNESSKDNPVSNVNPGNETPPDGEKTPGTEATPGGENGTGNPTPGGNPAPVVATKSFESAFAELNLASDRNACSAILAHEISKILANTQNTQIKIKRWQLNDVMDLHFYSLSGSAAWLEYQRIVQLKSLGVVTIEYALPRTFSVGVRNLKFLDQPQFAIKFNSEKQVFSEKISPEFFGDLTSIYKEYVGDPEGLALWITCALPPSKEPMLLCRAHRDASNSVFIKVDYDGGNAAVAMPYVNLSVTSNDLNLAPGEIERLPHGGSIIFATPKFNTGGLNIPINAIAANTNTDFSCNPIVPPVAVELPDSCEMQRVRMLVEGFNDAETYAQLKKMNWVELISENYYEVSTCESFLSYYGK